MGKNTTILILQGILSDLETCISLNNHNKMEVEEIKSKIYKTIWEIKKGE